MKAFGILAALSAASFAAAPAAAAITADDMPCIGQRQAEDLIIFLLPTVVDVAGAACTGMLPLGSHLTAGSGTRYRAESESAWPNARDTFGGSDKGIGALLGENGLRSMMTSTVAKEARRVLKPDSCAAADRLFAGLAPLPARSVAQILISLGQLAHADKRLPIRLCPPPPAALAPPPVPQPR